MFEREAGFVQEACGALGSRSGEGKCQSQSFQTRELTQVAAVAVRSLTHSLVQTDAVHLAINPLFCLF